jgi:hypothetical protein
VFLVILYFPFRELEIASFVRNNPFDIIGSVFIFLIVTGLVAMTGFAIHDAFSPIRLYLNGRCVCGFELSDLLSDIAQENCIELKKMVDEDADIRNFIKRTNQCARKPIRAELSLIRQHYASREQRASCAALAKI